MILVTLVIISCQSNNDEDLLNSEFSVFKKNFPELAPKISYSNVQKIINNYSAKSENFMDGITFPIMDNNEVIGRYMGTSDENISVYIDFSDYKNIITIYDATNPSKFQSVKMVLDHSTNTYKPDPKLQAKDFWCNMTCTIGAIAIASSDGPAPLMDALAVSFVIACLADCAEE